MTSVLVTGGAKRVGKAVVQRFAEAGWHVVIHYNTSRDAADALAAQLPSAEVVQTDLCDADAAVAMVLELTARLEDFRTIVSSASVFTKDDASDFDPATCREAMQVNAVTPVRMAQAFFDHARSTGGRVFVQITDQKLRNINPDFFSYTMSKAAVASAVDMLGMTAKGRDRAYAIAPGAILPSHDQSEEEAQRSHRMNLLQRRTRPEEIAEAALMMAGGHLKSGTHLYVDSGQHLLDQDRDVIFLARGEAA